MSLSIFIKSHLKPKKDSLQYSVLSLQPRQSCHPVEKRDPVPYHDIQHGDPVHYLGTMRELYAVVAFLFDISVFCY